MTDVVAGPKVPKPRAPWLPIDVTGKIIELSKKRDSSHCMVAEAVKASFKARFGYECSHVSVDIQTIRFSDPRKGYRYTYLTPVVAQRAILQFDQMITPDPFTFRLTQGQVTLASRRVNKPAAEKKPRTEAQKKATEKARTIMNAPFVPPTEPAELTEVEKAQRERLRKPELVTRSGNGYTEKQGGKPPLTTPVGKRRAFGLRSMDK